MKILLSSLFIAGAVSLSLTGCVTTIEPVEPLGKAQLLSSRAGGRATLRFESEKNVVYQILYARERNSQWRILPGGQHIVGTGEEMEFYDSIPLDENRRYRLRVKSIPIE